MQLLFLAFLASYGLLASAQSDLKTCIVSHAGANQDDSPALLQAASSTNCSSNASIVFESGVEYNLWTPVSLTLTNVTLEIKGNISLPTNITQVQVGVRSKDYKGGWIFISGSGVTLEGVGFKSSDGWIKSYGQQWWDAMNQVNRPGLFSFKASNSTITDIKILKPIAKSFNLAANNIQVSRVYIDAKSDTSAFPFNTDGFDVGGTNNSITSSFISNGDDCVAIGSPSQNFTFENNTCVGTHGVSIDAKGSPVKIDGIIVRNVRLVDSLYGARFKSDAGGVGLASNILYENIFVKNVTFPIYVTQNYFDQSVGPPTGTFNSSVSISGLEFKNFAGTINSLHPGDGSCISNPCWYAVPSSDGTQIIILDNLYANTTSGIRAENIAVLTQDKEHGGLWPNVICDPAKLTGEEIEGLGFKCWNGTYIPQL